MQKNSNLIKAALIAAVYVAVSLIFQPLNFGPLQLRVAEAVSVLVLYTPAAPFGLFVGCVITNIFSPYGLLDAVAGSLATLTAALIARKIKNRHLAMLPFVFVNALVVSIVICYTSSTMQLFFLNFIYLALSESLSVYILGEGLVKIIEKESKVKEFLKK